MAYVCIRWIGQGFTYSLPYMFNQYVNLLRLYNLIIMWNLIISQHETLRLTLCVYNKSLLAASSVNCNLFPSKFVLFQEQCRTIGVSFETPRSKSKCLVVKLVNNFDTLLHLHKMERNHLGKISEIKFITLYELTCIGIIHYGINLQCCFQRVQLKQLLIRAIWKRLLYKINKRWPNHVWN